MPFEIARHAGFCAGVRRAMEMAKAAAAKALKDNVPCVMLGELIHNPDALKELKALGVGEVETPLEAPRGAVIILRSHGEAPETYRLCRERELTVVDTTCRFVAALHELVYEHAQKGLPVLLLGDPKHPEIIGTAGFGRGHVHIISRREDIDNLPPLTAPLLVARLSFTERNVLCASRTAWKSMSPDWYCDRARFVESVAEVRASLRDCILFCSLTNAVMAFSASSRARMIVFSYWR